ncbi:hypothetical protein ACFQ48_14005 [Hymenobacter caeli]|uniref:MipA/OmpV family protein n=1 Tax=Hymenobacter caeli TaxID=2735894 RepID=A0ABX2FU34_9BACT|nr:hypothetical protein [Hymenobacter caeli]NRT20482.1 hypothetical protein [Hymenobacter caeli]
MKYLLLLIIPLLSLPHQLRAQSKGSPSPMAAPDTAEWTVALDADQRTYYLGREYGDHALALTPSVMYSHPSGFYGQIAGYYFRQSAPPRYSFTDVEVGFANEFMPAWTYSVSLDRVFYTQKLGSDEPRINNGFEANTAYALGPLSLAVDYNFFFQQQKAQTVSVLLSGTVKKAHWLGADDVRLTPGAEVYYGSPLALLRYGGTYVAPGAVAAAPTRRRRANNASTVPDETARPRLMGYELTLPLAYTRYPWAYAVTGHYVLPVRTGTDAAAEVLRPAAYASFRVDFTFR